MNQDSSQFYENGMPYKPLYEAAIDGFKQNTGFVPFSYLDKNNKFLPNYENDTPLILVVSITELIYKEIIEKRSFEIETDEEVYK